MELREVNRSVAVNVDLTHHQLHIEVCAYVCVDMCVDTCADMAVDMWVENAIYHRCMSMPACIKVRSETCAAGWAGMLTTVRIDMCVDMPDLHVCPADV